MQDLPGGGAFLWRGRFQQELRRTAGSGVTGVQHPDCLPQVPALRFLFTTAFDKWGSKEFAQAIYNEDYALVDSDYQELRPMGNAGFLGKVFEADKGRLSLLDFDEGMVVFSTLIQPTDFGQIGLAWWYVGPRNGHISIFSKQALGELWGRQGFSVGSFNDNLHIAFRQLRAFAKRLVSG